MDWEDFFLMKKALQESLTILQKLIQNKTPLSHTLSPETPSNVKALSFGVSRQFFRLQAILKELILKKIDFEEPSIAILMGLHQLLYSDKPEHAVVNEMTNLMQTIQKTWAKGFVNGVLRRFLREKDVILKKLENNIAFKYGHPAWFIERIKKDWPEHYSSILEANNAHPPMTLRVNLKKLSREEAIALLKKSSIQAHAHPFIESAILLETPCSISELPGFSEGLLSVQDAAAQIAANLIELLPHQRVLDACAAPGGKTLHLLETEPLLSKCVALDIDEQRLRRVEENLKRGQLNALLTLGDAANPSSFWDGQLFDRILLDAPCTATGVIRRHPDIRILRTEKDIHDVTQLQKKILHALWPLLKKGSVMIYATCSILKEENEKQISYFSEKHPDCMIVETKIPFGHWTGYGTQILPGENNCDGFFYSKLVKK